MYIELSEIYKREDEISLIIQITIVRIFRERSLEYFKTSLKFQTNIFLVKFANKLIIRYVRINLSEMETKDDRHIITKN